VGQRICVCSSTQVREQLRGRCQWGHGAVAQTAGVSSADKQMPQGRSTDTTTGHERQRTLLGVVGQSWADLVFAQHSQRRNAKRILLCARCRRHHAHPANTACSEAPNTFAVCVTKGSRLSKVGMRIGKQDCLVSECIKFEAPERVLATSQLGNAKDGGRSHGGRRCLPCQSSVPTPHAPSTRKVYSRIDSYSCRACQLRAEKVGGRQSPYPQHLCVSQCL